MRTWQELYEQAQSISGDDSAATLALLKSDINLGGHRLNAAIGRYFTRKQKSANLVADQQYYQLPPDCVRVKKVTATVSGGDVYPVKQIRSEFEWDALNIDTQSSDYITYFFVRGHDEIGLWPVPSTAVTSGLTIAYEPRDKDLTQDDFSTGTVTVTNGSTTVTHSGTSFTPQMANRVFKVTDGTDGFWYKIASAPTTSTLTLEEPYLGISGSGRTFKVGEVFLFPPEYHDAPIDFALSRFFELRQNPQRAQYHKMKYEEAVREVKEKYSSSTTSQVITGERDGYNLWLIPPNPVT